MTKQGMAQRVNPNTLRAMQEDECETIACNGDRPLLEIVGITAERLQHIESHLFRLELALFGAYPCDSDCAKIPHEPSVRDRALDAFGTSVRIERMVESLIRRTEIN